MTSSNDEENDEDSSSVPDFNTMALNGMNVLYELASKVKVKSYKVKIKLEKGNVENEGDVATYIAKYLKTFKVNVDALIVAYANNLKTLTKNGKHEELLQALNMLETIKDHCYCPNSIGAFDHEFNVVRASSAPVNDEVKNEISQDSCAANLSKGNEDGENDAQGNDSQNNNFDSADKEKRQEVERNDTEGDTEDENTKKDDENDNQAKKTDAENPRRSNLSLRKTDTQNTNDSWVDTLSRNSDEKNLLPKQAKVEEQSVNKKNEVDGVDVDVAKKVLGFISSKGESITSPGDKEKSDKQIEGSLSSEANTPTRPSRQSLRMMYVDRHDKRTKRRLVSTETTSDSESVKREDNDKGDSVASDSDHALNESNSNTATKKNIKNADSNSDDAVDNDNVVSDSDNTDVDDDKDTATKNNIKNAARKSDSAVGSDNVVSDSDNTDTDDDNDTATKNKIKDDARKSDVTVDNDNIVSDSDHTDIDDNNDTSTKSNIENTVGESDNVASDSDNDSDNVITVKNNTKNDTNKGNTVARDDTVASDSDNDTSAKNNSENAVGNSDNVAVDNDNVSSDSDNHHTNIKNDTATKKNTENAVDNSDEVVDNDNVASDDALASNDSTLTYIDSSVDSVISKSVSESNAIKENDLMSEDTEADTLQNVEELPKDNVQNEREATDVENNADSDNESTNTENLLENIENSDSEKRTESQTTGSLDMTLSQIEAYVNDDDVCNDLQEKNDDDVKESSQKVDEGKLQERNGANTSEETIILDSTANKLENCSHNLSAVDSLHIEDDLKDIDKELEELLTRTDDIEREGQNEGANTTSDTSEPNVTSNEDKTDNAGNSEETTIGDTNDKDNTEDEDDPDLTQVLENNKESNENERDTEKLTENTETGEISSQRSFIFDINSEGNETTQEGNDTIESSMDNTISEGLALDIDISTPDVKEGSLKDFEEKYSQVISNFIRDKNLVQSQEMGDEDRNELLHMLEEHINVQNASTEDDTFSETPPDEREMRKNRDALEQLLDDYLQNQDQKASKSSTLIPTTSISDPISTTALLDVVLEEVLNEDEVVCKNEMTDTSYAEHILKMWDDEKDESFDSHVGSTSDQPAMSDSSVSDVDIEKSDIENSNSDEVKSESESEKQSETESEKEWFIIKDLKVMLERCQVNGHDIPMTLPRRKRRRERSQTSSGSDIDRLCDIATLDNPNRTVTRSARKRLLMKKAKRQRNRSSSSSTSGSSLGWSDDGMNDEAGRWSDPDDLGVAPLGVSDNEGCMANAVLDLIRDSAAGTDADDESGDERRKKKKAKGDDEDTSKRKKRKRSRWQYDRLLQAKLWSGSDKSDKSDDSNVSGNNRKKTKVSGSQSSEMDSDATVINEVTIKDEVITPRKDLLFNLGTDGNSSDSEVEFVTDKKTPKKIIPSSQEETDADKEEDDEDELRKKGRRNIRSLLTDENLAESTQKANREEEERIARLEEKKKLVESLSQSVGSQDIVEDKFVLDYDQESSEPLIVVHDRLTERLKPHQRNGVQFMWDSCYESVKRLKKDSGSGCILAHCMGLGKTLQALTLIHTLFTHAVTNTMYVLVVCPLSTVSNWKKEFDIAFRKIKRNNINIFTLVDQKGTPNKADVVRKWHRKTGILVMGYEAFGILTNEKKLSKTISPRKRGAVLAALVDPGPDLVVCDEGHLLKNKQTQRTLALNKVKTKRRIVLTGTPLQNNLTEYYHMVHFVKPNLLGTEKEFKTNFVNPISNGQYEDSTYEDIKLMKKRTHILHRVLENTVQRVEDNELEIYLPKRVDYAVFIQLSPLQANLYHTYMSEARDLRDASHKCFLTDVQVVKYICSHPYILDEANSLDQRKIKEKDVLEDNVDRPEGSNSFAREFWKALQPKDIHKLFEYGHKLLVVKNIIEECEAVEDKVLIFSQSIAEMNVIEHFLMKCGTAKCPSWKPKRDYYRMDGTIAPEVRTLMCNNFNDKNNKKLRVFIMSTKVGGLGLNLTAANRVIIMTVNWNPSYDTQSVFRAYRFGQNKSVYIYRLIAIDTMEEKIYQRQVTKLAIAHRVVDRHQITRHYSSMDLEELYSLRPDINKERPLPRVPEDKVLAKLIQRLPCVYKWHEHRALLANRPEEDLNEQEKKDAWEEFTKREKEPPPMPPVGAANMIPPYPQPHFVTASNLVMPNTSSNAFNNTNVTPTIQRVDPLNGISFQFRPNFYPASQPPTRQNPFVPNYNNPMARPTLSTLPNTQPAQPVSKIQQTQNVAKPQQPVVVPIKPMTVASKPVAIPPKPLANASVVGAENAANNRSSPTVLSNRSSPTVSNNRSSPTVSNTLRHTLMLPAATTIRLGPAQQDKVKDPLRLPDGMAGKSQQQTKSTTEPLTIKDILDAKKLHPTTSTKSTLKKPVHRVIIRKSPHMPGSPKLTKIVNAKPIDLTKTLNGAIPKSASPKAIDLTLKRNPVAKHQAVKVPTPLPAAAIQANKPLKIYGPQLDSKAKRNLQVFSNNGNKENRKNKEGLWVIPRPQVSTDAQQMTDKFMERLKKSGVSMEPYSSGESVVSDTTSGGSSRSIHTDLIKSLSMNGVSINKVKENGGKSTPNKVYTID